MRTIEELLQQLGAFDLADLAAGIGALQLLPVNAERQFRLEQAAALILSNCFEADRPRMSNSRWRQMLNEPPVADQWIKGAEDPSEDLFTDSLMFIGGSFLVFPGINTHVAEIVRCLLQACFLFRDPLPPAYVDYARDLCFGVLQLSNAIAIKADLQRGMPSQGSSGDDVEIPDARKFARLKQAVTFSPEEIGDLLQGVDSSSLDPLSITAESLPLIGVESGLVNPAEKLFSNPILRSRDSWIVVVPSALLPALRHRLILSAAEAGVLPELAERYRLAVSSRAARSLKWMSWVRAPASPRESLSGTEESLWSLDLDKLGHVIVITDDLSDYDQDSIDGTWKSGLLERIEPHLQSQRLELRQRFSKVNSILHLVVFQGVGRSIMLGLKEPPEIGRASTLLVSQPDLAVIARMETANSLGLWKFSQALDRLRQSTAVMPADTLDEYTVYHQSESSFYFSDDRSLPDTLSIVPGTGAHLRQRDAARFDYHGALSWSGSGIIEVQRLYHGSSIPVYIPDPLASQGLAFLVETLEIPLWVYAASESAEKQRHLSWDFCEAIAYWIWQVSPSLEGLVERMQSDLLRIAIRVDVEDTPAWTRPQQTEEPGSWVTYSAGSDGTLSLNISAGGGAILTSATNEGERYLLAQILDGLKALTSLCSGPGIALDTAAVVDEHAPLGNKKKLLAVNVHENTKLTPGPLPPVRLIQDADVAMVLDARGSKVSAELGLEVGPIAPDRRTEVLKKVVESYFDELRGLLRGLSPEGLLERLVAENESLIREEAQLSLNLPARQACFGSESDFLDSMQERITDLEAADRANRFLIEYVTACTPRGSERFSLGSYDLALALASEIISKGMLSDGIWYSLADTGLSILPSGRLGIERTGRYVTSIDSFGRFLSDKRIANVLGGFEAHWKGDSSGSGSSASSSASEEIDNAARSEFGLSVVELGSLFGHLKGIGLDLRAEPKVMPLHSLCLQLQERLEWPGERVRAAVEEFCLRPRKRYIPRDREADVYPWRFNRALSYVRRPLLVRRTEDGDEELIWGIRHLERFGFNFMHLILSGRLKARSRGMQVFISKRRAARSEEFNDRVAEVFEQQEGIIVRRRVGRIGGDLIERRRGESLGDVDVLVANPRRRVLLAIEVKDFELSKTPFELSNELKKLLIGESSALARHLERLSWLEDHLSDVAMYLGVGKVRGWKVRGLIVVSRRLLSPLMEDSAIDVVSMEELEAGQGVPW